MKEVIVGVLPQCLHNRMNLPHGYVHTVVVFKGYSDHGPGGRNYPRYTNTKDVDMSHYDRGYDEEGKSNASPDEIDAFLRQYGTHYQSLGRNCQDFSRNFVHFLITAHPC